MPRTIISEGKTSTEAIEKGLKELRVSRNQVEIKILEEKKKSFFNILDPHVVRVEITTKDDENIIPEVAEKTLIDVRDTAEATQTTVTATKSKLVKIKKFLKKLLWTLLESQYRYLQFILL